MKLVTDDGVTHDSPNNILKEEVKYFKNMFSFQSLPSPPIKANCMDLFPINNVQWTSVQKDSCEGQITEEELHDTIKAFKSGKTPGLDGIEVEEYQTFFIYSEGHY